MNFLCRFIPSFTEHLIEMTNMLKNDNEVKWSEEARKSFHAMKLSLTISPSLISPDYIDYFIIFSFASEHTIIVVLMQKWDKTEMPISFFSHNIKDATLKYNIIEKQALDLVKAVKDFRVYILHSHTLAYVPNAAVKQVLVQNDPEGRRGRWITTLL